MKNLWILLLLLLGLLLTGCGSDGISTTALSSILNGTEAIGDDIVEASVAKEMVVHKTLQNRDDNYMKAYKKSGFSIKFALVTVSGIDMYLPSAIEYKPEPDFNTPLPTEPSKHPVWETVNVIGSKAIDATLIGYGIHEIAKTWSASVKGAQGTTYNGPVQGSFNSAGNDQSTIVLRDYAPITSGGTP